MFAVIDIELFCIMYCKISLRRMTSVESIINSKEFVVKLKG